MEACVKSLPRQDYIISWKPTGSYIICNPPVENTDRDILLLVQKRGLYTNVLSVCDWKVCGEDYGEGDFVALRKGIYNLIVTDNEIYYHLFSQATDLAKKLNLKEKQQRIDLFDYVIKSQI